MPLFGKSSATSQSEQLVKRDGQGRMEEDANRENSLSPENSLLDTDGRATDYPATTGGLPAPTSERERQRRARPVTSKSIPRLD